MNREPLTMNRFVSHSITRALECGHILAAKNLSNFTVQSTVSARMRLLEDELTANEEEHRDMETEYEELMGVLEDMGIRQ